MRQLFRSTMALGVAACLTLMAGPANAGNIVLTGHDDDFHSTFEGIGSAPNNQLLDMVAFARNGSALPVLCFDSNASGTYKLRDRLLANGIAFTLVDVNTSVHTAANLATAASNWDPTLYSAMVVGSVVTCGGCDIRVGHIAALLGDAANKLLIKDFVNAGRGIAAFSGATDGSAYSYLPATAAPFGSPPSSPYFQTTDGAANSIRAVDGDPTHNFFDLSTSDPAYLAFERLGNATTGTVETIGVKNAHIGDTGFDPVPAPAGVILLGTGIMSLGGFKWRRRKLAV